MFSEYHIAAKKKRPRKQSASTLTGTSIPENVFCAGAGAGVGEEGDITGYGCPGTAHDIVLQE